jgi:Glycosyltransferase sugar-binding region containing DXD motif
MWEKWIAGDFMRLQIMHDIGGIYLDNDIYVVNSLDHYRKFDVSHLPCDLRPINRSFNFLPLQATLSWRTEKDENVAAMVLIGHKDARIWPVWFHSLGDWSNNSLEWYYVSKGFTHFIWKYPDVERLFHREPERLMVGGK